MQNSCRNNILLLLSSAIIIQWNHEMITGKFSCKNFEHVLSFQLVSIHQFKQKIHDFFEKFPICLDNRIIDQELIKWFYTKDIFTDNRKVLWMKSMNTDKQLIDSKLVLKNLPLLIKQKYHFFQWLERILWGLI